MKLIRIKILWFLFFIGILLYFIVSSVTWNKLNLSNEPHPKIDCVSKNCEELIELFKKCSRDESKCEEIDRDELIEWKLESFFTNVKFWSHVTVNWKEIYVASGLWWDIYAVLFDQYGKRVIRNKLEYLSDVEEIRIYRKNMRSKAYSWITEMLYIREL